MIENDMDYFYDLKVWKDDVEKLLKMKISDEEFDKVMESFAIFHLDDLVFNYIRLYRESINSLLVSERKDNQLEMELTDGEH